MRIELALHHIFLHIAVRAFPQHHKRDRKLIAYIHALVDHKAVEFRQLGDDADIGGEEQIHKADLMPLRAFGHNIARKMLIIRLKLQHDLRVTAHRHQIGGQGDDRVIIQAHRAAV